MTTGDAARIPGAALPLPPGRARVLVAVCTLARPTVRSVALAAGLSPSATYHQLRILRHQGFVEWGHDFSGRTLAGTLTATHRPHLPHIRCECGKPAPYDGGRAGVCECCSTCGPA